jgi:hypothetical protein
VDDVAKEITAGETCALTAALLLDPDDATTNQFPVNEVEHDVLAEHNVGLNGATSFGGFWNGQPEWIYFEDTEDVITARNMRFNSIASGTEVDGAFHECTIYYTLEKIQDAQIMELLDIL